MSGVRRGWMLPAVLAAMMAVWVSPVRAQLSTTTVQDTVYSGVGELERIHDGEWSVGGGGQYFGNDRRRWLADDLARTECRVNADG
jgi:hypothetical protein